MEQLGKTFKNMHPTTCLHSLLNGDIFMNQNHKILRQPLTVNDKSDNYECKSQRGCQKL